MPTVGLVLQVVKLRQDTLLVGSRLNLEHLSLCPVQQADLSFPTLGVGDLGSLILFQFGFAGPSQEAGRFSGWDTDLAKGLKIVINSSCKFLFSSLFCSPWPIGFS